MIHCTPDSMLWQLTLLPPTAQSLISPTLWPWSRLPSLQPFHISRLSLAWKLVSYWLLWTQLWRSAKLTISQAATNVVHLDARFNVYQFLFGFSNLRCYDVWHLICKLVCSPCGLACVSSSYSICIPHRQTSFQPDCPLSTPSILNKNIVHGCLSVSVCCSPLTPAMSHFPRFGMSRPFHFPFLSVMRLSITRIFNLFNVSRKWPRKGYSLRPPHWWIVLLAFSTLKLVGSGILFGDMAVVMKALANKTGTNPGFYDAAWHVLYPR